MPFTVCLHPVLQVGVNPPGIKTSFSLPLQQDRSTALGIPRCQGSQALEARTRSVLSSRITCSPTVRTGLLGEKKVYGALRGGWEMGGRQMSDRRVRPPASAAPRVRAARWDAAALRGWSPTAGVGTASPQLAFPWPGLKGKITRKLRKILAI